MRFEVLGPVTATLDDRPVRLTPMGRSLLAVLLLDANRPVSEARLIEALWGDSPPPTSKAALQNAVLRLRRAFGPPDSSRVRRIFDGYLIEVPAAGLDLQEFDDLCRSGTRASEAGRWPEAADALSRALALWRGDPLADALPATRQAVGVDRICEARLQAGEQLARARLALGQYGAVVVELLPLARQHPWREPIHGHLMHALHGSGRQAEALNVYQELRAGLVEELGVEPSAAVAEMHQRILAADPSLIDPARATITATMPSTAEDARGVAKQLPPRTAYFTGGADVLATLNNDLGDGSDCSSGTATSLAEAGLSPRADPLSVQPDPPTYPPQRTSNLPRRLTSFVGRDAEVERISELLASRRLVTVVGPGGSGKSRLAIEAVARLAGRWSDGCWLVELAAVSDPRLVVTTVLSTLGIVENTRGAESGLDPYERLAAALSGRGMLLIVDNCEHVLEGAARLIEEVLARCPGVSVVATSRESVNVEGEHLCPLPPLAVPGVRATLEEAAQSPAVQLLIDRASAVSPGFVLSEDNCEAVCAICRQLDGIPLAIELAATRMRAVTPAQLLAGLDDRFRLLISGSRTALPRHQTLRAVIAWSWDLLSAPERELARRFSVFAGSASVDSVRQVCGGRLGTLASLVDKSLIEVVGDRYRMLDTIRAYADEELTAAGEGAGLSRAHADYFADLFGRTEPALRSAEQSMGLARLSSEHDNCVAAIGWAADTGDAECLIRLCGSLMWYLLLRGFRSEMSCWRAAVRELVAGDPPVGVTADYLACLHAPDIPNIQDFFEPLRWKPIADSTGEYGRFLLQARSEEAQPHPIFTIIEAWQDAEQGSTDRFQRCVTSDDPWVASFAQLLRGGSRLDEGRHGDATTDLAGAVSGFRRVGDRFGLSRALLTLATAHVRIGRQHTADPLMTEAAELITPGVGAVEAVSSFTWLAHLRFWNEDAAGAAADLFRARAHLSEGTPVEILAQLCVVEADVARLGGDLATALAVYVEALGHLERSARPEPGRPPMTPSTAVTEMWTRTSYAIALADAGEFQEADAQLLLALETARNADNLPFLPSVGIGFATAAAAQGNTERALTILQAGASLPSRQGHLGPDVSCLRANMRSTLGDRGYEQAMKCSRRTSVTDFIELLARPQHV